MKEICKQYAAYNLWANQRLIEMILQLTPAEQQKALPGSFESIFKLLQHMWDAESIWWQRIKLLEPIVLPSKTTRDDIAELGQGLLQQSKKWMEWTDSASKPALEHVVAYRNSKKEQFKQPVFQIILHVINHQTYHRGQLVNQLRQLEKENIPPTDFIIWSMSRKQ